MIRLFCSVNSALLVLVLATTSVHAQTHVILTNFGGTLNDKGRITDIDLDSGSVNWAMSALTPPLDGWVPYGAPAISSDGRFVVWMAGKIIRQFLIHGGFVARDLVTGSVLKGELPGGFVRDLVGHTRKPMLFATTTLGLIIIESSGFRQTPACAGDMAITLDGSELFVACGDGRVQVFDTQRAAIVREIVLPQPHSWSLIEVNGDGSRLVTLSDRSPFEFSVAVYDGQTGQPLGLGSVPAGPPCCAHAQFGSLSVNAARTEIYAGFLFTDFTTGEAGETRIYRFDTLTNVASAPIPLSSLAFTPDGRKAVAIANWDIRPGARCLAVLIDVQMRAVERSSYSSTCGLFSGVGIASPPLPPENVKVSATNRRVTLSWQLAAHSPAATTYAIDASLQPGGRVVATLLTDSDQTIFTLDAVPPGTYYVRVRGVNAIGASELSAEQQLVVR